MWAAFRILTDCGSMDVVACKDMGSKGCDLALEGLGACMGLHGNTCQGAEGAWDLVHTFQGVASTRHRMALACA